MKDKIRRVVFIFLIGLTLVSCQPDGTGLFDILSGYDCSRKDSLNLPDNLKNTKWSYKRDGLARVTCISFSDDDITITRYESGKITSEFQLKEKVNESIGWKEQSDSNGYSIQLINMSGKWGEPITLFKCYYSFNANGSILNVDCVEYGNWSTLEYPYNNIDSSLMSNIYTDLTGNKYQLVP